MRSWLSVLEASYVVLRVAPWHANLGKRLVKTPKIYFVDTGLLCALLGIRAAGQLVEHPLRGAVFENWVVTEIPKSRTHRALPSDLFFFRSRAGLEVDVLVDAGASLLAAEVKTGRTVASDFFGSLEGQRSLVLGATPERRLRRRLVYGGETARRWRGVDVVPWSRVADMPW